MSENTIFINEEDIRSKLVTPLLVKLGFQENELLFENNFTLRLGRNVYRVDNEKQVTTATGKSDILVKRGETNLCIVEVKRDSKEISTDDIDQAVSYARLIDPIAHFCIVTNGQKSKIIDPITKEELTQDNFPYLNFKGHVPNFDLYYESFQYFINLSKENLTTFFKIQFDQNVEQLRGSKQQQNRTYIEEIYEASKELQTSFDEFLKSDSKLFVVVGDTGKGKTNWICHTAYEAINNGQPTFFYRSRDIQEGIFKSIIEDVLWEFSVDFTETQGIKRIFDVFKKQNILIFIDGIDERNIENTRLLLESCLKKIKYYNVKIICTCKSTAWNQFIVDDGIPTKISDEINKSIVEKKKKSLFLMQEFNNLEYFYLFRKYCRFYDHEIGLDGKIDKECRRNPFLLKIIFEVAVQNQVKHFLHNTIDVYSKYWEYLKIRINSKEAVKFLEYLAKFSFDHNTDEIKENQFREEYNIPFYLPLPEKLFQLNIIEYTDNEKKHLSFYYSKLRDYILNFHVLNWHEKSLDELRFELSQTSLSKVKFEVIQLFYVLASPDQKRLLDEKVYQRALIYFVLVQCQGQYLKKS